ncbi:hypothetical protein D3C81_1352190 [compost metagenome]
MGEAGGPAVLDQAVHLRQPGAGSEQQQRTVGQLGQVAVAERQLHPGQPLATDEVEQAARALVAGEDVQLQLAPGVRRRGDGEGRLTAVLALQQQILPGVVARRLAGRRAQAQAEHVAAHRLALDQLAGQLAHRQLAGRQHAVPVQHAIFQRLGEAGEQLAMVQLGALLAHPAFHQQRGADVAVAVAAALRAVEAEPACSVEDALAGQQFQAEAGGL